MPCFGYTRELDCEKCEKKTTNVFIVEKVANQGSQTACHQVGWSCKICKTLFVVDIPLTEHALENYRQQQRDKKPASPLDTIGTPRIVPPLQHTKK